MSRTTPSLDRSNVYSAAEAIIANARALQNAKLDGRPRTRKILAELRHDLEDALRSVRALEDCNVPPEAGQ